MSLKLDLLKIARRFPLLIQLSRQFRRSRRRLFEFFGSRYYSKTADPETADSEIDTKLEEYLPFRNGFFIEVGAHNGFYESNTYHLEKFKGWKGVLVEPVPELFKECIKERPNSKVYNCALVPHDYPNTTIELFFADGTTHVKGIQNDNPSYLKKIREVGEKYSIPHYTARVPVRTLDSILDELAIKQIDFFSLDVEGFEVDVLKGLSFDKYKPSYMLIECLTQQSKDKLDAYMAGHYTCIRQFSNRDYLYRSNYMDEVTS